jgi:hypothetical protein
LAGVIVAAHQPIFLANNMRNNFYSHDNVGVFNAFIVGVFNAKIHLMWSAQIVLYFLRVILVCSNTNRCLESVFFFRGKTMFENLSEAALFI